MTEQAVKCLCHIWLSSCSTPTSSQAAHVWHISLWLHLSARDELGRCLVSAVTSQRFALSFIVLTSVQCLTCCSLSTVVSAVLEMCTKPGLVVGSEGTSKTSPKPSSILFTTMSCTSFMQWLTEVRAQPPQVAHKQKHGHCQKHCFGHRHCHGHSYSHHQQRINCSCGCIHS